MEIKIDPDWEIRKLFRDTVKIAFYRDIYDEKTDNMIEFFSDYYQVIKLKSLEELEPGIDILNLENEQDAVNKFNANIWIETADKEITKPKHFKGLMKDLYIQIFMEHCSA